MCVCVCVCSRVSSGVCANVFPYIVFYTLPAPVVAARRCQAQLHPFWVFSQIERFIWIKGHLNSGIRYKAQTERVWGCERPWPPRHCSNVFVNRMSLTLGTGQAHNDFCLLWCVCFESGGGARVGARERERERGGGFDKISNKTLRILPLINQRPHSFSQNCPCTVLSKQHPG